MAEIWKAISNYEGLYEVSNLGRVRRLLGYSFLTENGKYRAYVYEKDGRKTIGTFETKEDAEKAKKEYVKTHDVIENKILKFREVKGHYQVALSKKCKYKNFYVHRLVADAFIENPNNYNIVNHKDNNGLNNAVNNLEWCTQKYNVNYSSEQMKKPKSTNNKNKYIRFKNNKYEVSIRLNDFKYYVRCNSIEEAIIKRDGAMKEYELQKQKVKGLCNISRST